MRSTVILTLNLFLLLNLLAAPMVFSASHNKSSPSDSIDAKEIISKADRSRGFESDFTLVTQVTEFVGTKNLRQTKYKIYNNGHEKTLVDTIFPPRQKGRKLLMVEDNLWFYTPDIKRATRVSLQQKLTGEVSNGDLARTNFSGDYEPKIISEAVTINGRKAWKLSLTAKSKSVTYNGIIYWVEKNTYLPILAYFLTSSGKVLKKCEYSKTSKVLGRKLITEIKITDALQPTRFTILKYSNFKKGPIDAAIFNKDSFGNE